MGYLSFGKAIIFAFRYPLMQNLDASFAAACIKNKKCGEKCFNRCNASLKNQLLDFFIDLCCFNYFFCVAQIMNLLSTHLASFKVSLHHPITVEFKIFLYHIAWWDVNISFFFQTNIYLFLFDCIFSSTFVSGNMDG